MLKKMIRLASLEIRNGNIYHYFDNLTLCGNPTKRQILSSPPLPGVRIFIITLTFNYIQHIIFLYKYIFYICIFSLFDGILKIPHW